MYPDFLYETALAAATGILQTLGDGHLTAEKLATVTYAILEAMRQVERQRLLPCSGLRIAPSPSGDAS